MSLPHARGGVSYVIDSGLSYSESSPRTWGCFLLVLEISTLSGVFPTHVGVFLLFMCAPLRRKRLPHARGGVSRVASAPR